FGNRNADIPNKTRKYYPTIVETITEASTAETEPRRNSEFSTSSLVGKMGNQLNIQSQEIIDEEMTDADNRENKDNSGASAKAHNSKDKATDMV
ncbi:7534_t:CDS:2, partial [Diversispora eburnea]